MRPAFTIIALVLATVFLAADEIQLHDGVVIRGRITAETSASVMMKTPSGTLIVDRSTIARMTKSDTATPKNEAPTQPPPQKGQPDSTQLGAEFWPPRLNQRFPELTLYNQHGKVVTLSKLARGRAILLEPVGMSCRACQAFSGGHDYGAFQGVEPQADLESIEKSFPRYTGGESLANPRIVFVQLILFDMNMKAPSPDAVRDWAKHFKLAHKPNTYILAGTPEMVSQASFDMIPGFFLIDKKFVLKSDATGHRPKNNLWREVLPSIPLTLR